MIIGGTDQEGPGVGESYTLSQSPGFSVCGMRVYLPPRAVLRLWREDGILHPHLYSSFQGVSDPANVTPLMLEAAVPGIYMYQPILYLGSCGSCAILVALRSLGTSPSLFQSQFLHPSSGQIVWAPSCSPTPPLPCRGLVYRRPFF